MDSDTPGPVPEDFPRSPHPGAVSGFQRKIPIRMVDGKFIDRWTDAELLERYDNCADLVEQLTAYCHRKLAELPGATPENPLPRVRLGVLNKAWDLTAPSSSGAWSVWAHKFQRRQHETQRERCPEGLATAPSVGVIFGILSSVRVATRPLSHRPNLDRKEPKV